MVDATAEQRVRFPVLRASWDSLTFVHWRVPREHIQLLLPHGLTVDEFDGAAWVGMTPFVMAHMSPLGLRLPPTLSCLASTPETNLRTYVRGPDGRDGLWFLTLEVGSAFMAGAVRALVGAPYHRARLTAEHSRDTVTYAGTRKAGPSYRLQVRPGAPVRQSPLETWLTGRWRAYTEHLGRLLVTPVEHEPWRLRQAQVSALEQDLTRFVGLGDLPGPPLVHFSDGVHQVRLGRPVLLRQP
jgi:uncharacterized protein YqjF (DUF2071 family)